MQQPYHSRQNIGGGHVMGGLVTQLVPVGTERAVPAQAGRQADGLARWARAEWLLHFCCFSCVLQLDTQMRMQPDHSMLLSSPSGELSKPYRTEKYPIHTPSWSCRELETLQSHEQRELNTLLP